MKHSLKVPAHFGVAQVPACAIDLLGDGVWLGVFDVDAAMLVGVGVPVSDDEGAAGDAAGDADGTTAAGVDDAEGATGAGLVGVADADGAPRSVVMTMLENAAVDVPAQEPPVAQAPVASMLAALPDALDRYAIGTMPVAKFAAIVAR